MSELYLSFQKNYMIRFFLALFTASTFFTLSVHSQLPEGFVEEVAYDQIYLPGGILFPSESSTLIYNLEGKVWVMTNDEFPLEPDIDITEEVARYGDLGLIGATSHPDFAENGYIYLYYCVDFHYLEFFGTPDYDPEFTQEEISMGRITRYTIDPTTLDLIEGSRKIILGEEIGSGIPICAPAHGVGNLMFGDDGSLIATAGDGNTWVGTSSTTGFNGEGPPPAFAFDDIAVEKGLISPLENLGAFRAQYLDGLNGKVLRIHPETGEGLPNNPFFEEDNPNSNRSKVWALGFRNPYRFTIMEGTGQGDLADGHPGTIVLSDVGDWVWEEVNFVTDGGSNFGWPMFQGPMLYNYYYGVPTRNVNAPNPDNSQGCSEFLNYQDVILQEKLQPDYSFSNPCNENELLPDSIKTFVHTRPALSYANSANETNFIVPLIAAVSTFDENGIADFTSIDDMENISGDGFTGISGTGGVFLNGESLPPEYQGEYLLADYSGWLRSIKFDETNQPVEVDSWSDDIGACVNITQNPYNQCIYITTIVPSEIKKICFGGNLKPIIEVTPDTVYGVGTLNVEFDASDSYDPEGEALSFTWHFDDGSTESGAIINKTFSPGGTGIEQSEVLLEVTDTEGAMASQIIHVSLNNTPPSVDISSITEGELYSIFSPTLFDLVCDVDDAESSTEEMEYSWTLILHHNTHFHYVDFFDGNNQSVLINPSDCNPFESYWYEIQVEVLDPGGLSDFDSRTIFPDCDGTLEPPETEASFNLYPNPVSTILTVSSTRPLADSILMKLYDTVGREIRSDEVFIHDNRQFFRLDIRNLGKGTYILEFKNGDRTERIRFVKE